MIHFKIEEFEDKTAPGSGSKMQPRFLQMIDNARTIAGVPFRINSGYRTPEHNAKVGGKKDSAHVKGFAADIATTDARNRSIILTALIKAGFTRIGIGKTYLHADCDDSLPQNVMWDYYG
jgi:zinc D-Ala-D-Ala carboxypeptidase